MRTGLALPYMLGIYVISFSISMSLLLFFFFFLCVIFKKKKKKLGEKMRNFFLFLFFIFFSFDSFLDIAYVFA
jgi:hypothetical protein